MQKSEHVSAIILEPVKSRLLLSVGILLAVAGAIATSLFPPLILGKIIDTITTGQAVTIAMVVLYFLLIALTGFTEAAVRRLILDALLPGICANFFAGFEQFVGRCFHLFNCD